MRNSKLIPLQLFHCPKMLINKSDPIVSRTISKRVIILEVIEHNVANTIINLSNVFFEGNINV